MQPSLGRLHSKIILETFRYCNGYNYDASEIERNQQKKFIFSFGMIGRQKAYSMIIVNQIFFFFYNIRNQLAI